MFILSSFFVILSILTLKWFIQRWSFFNKLKPIPEARNTLPIIGNALDFLSPVVIIPNIMKIRGECGKVFKLIIGPMSTFVMSTDPKFAEFMLTSPKLIEKSADYEFMENWLGDGLITAPGSIWLKHRKILTPAFHFQILEKMVDQFSAMSNILIQQLNENINRELDIYPFITRFTLDVICDYWREQFIVRYLHSVTEGIIKTRRKELEKQKSLPFPEKKDDAGSKKRNALLDILLGFNLNDEEIRNEVNTFLFAGHDTTASGIGFTLYLLSSHPDIQSKLLEEITSTLGSNANANYNQLQEMKYLEMVIKESIRLYPAVPIIARRVCEDIVYNGTVIPKGARAAVFIYGMHREAETFKNPEMFDPERFSRENQSKRSAFSYVPFSAGQRNCIGQKFAMLSMKSIICQIIRNFELLPVSHRKPIICVETILKSTNGIYVQLRKRSFKSVP